MRNGYLRETPDGKIYSLSDLHQYQWNFASGTWTVVPGSCELCDQMDAAEAYETPKPKLAVGKVYIADNPDGTYRELGKLNGIEWGPVVGEDFGGETIRTDKTDSFTVTFDNVEPDPAWPVDMKAWDEVLRRERDRRRSDNYGRWFAPGGQVLSKRQISRSVYTPQPEDPLYTSEEIERAAQHLGVELVPWQKDLLSRIGKGDRLMVAPPRQWGRVNVTKVANKLVEWQGTTASEPIYDEISTEGKTLSKKERIAELEAQVETLENDNLELDKLSNFEHDRAIAAEVNFDAQLSINDVLKRRISNQRKELRNLNKALRKHSGEVSLLTGRSFQLANDLTGKTGVAESRQRTIERQQEIIDQQREQLAKKSWWRS